MMKKGRSMRMFAYSMMKLGKVKVSVKKKMLLQVLDLAQMQETMMTA